MAGFDAGILDVIENAMEDQRQEEALASQNYVKVFPAQMRLLRKMSAIGLDPNDFEAYKAKEKTGDEPLHAQALAVLAACCAFLLYAPEAGIIYCAFLPAILFAVWLAVRLPKEFASRREESKQEEDESMFDLMSTVRRRRRGHLEGRSKNATGESYLGEDSPGAQSMASHVSHHSRRHRQSHRHPGGADERTPRRRHLKTDSGNLDSATGSLAEDSYRLAAASGAPASASDSLKGQKESRDLDSPLTLHESSSAL